MTLESINTGAPIALSGPRRAISKNIARVAAFCLNIKTSKAQLAS
jgi:hypothetical protein